MRNERPGNTHIFTVVLTSSGNHRQGEGDGWKQPDATESKLRGAWLFGESSAVTAVWGEKSQGIPTAHMQLCFDIWMTDCRKDVFIFHSAYREVAMDGRNGPVSHVQWYTPHWQGSSVYCSGGSCWLLSHLKFLRDRKLLPVRQDSCLQGEVHYFILIAQRSGKKPCPLSFLLSTLFCIRAKAVLFDVYVQNKYIIFLLSIKNFSPNVPPFPKGHWCGAGW